MFELDGKKIYCNKEDMFSPTGRCEGLIDYDIGFNNLICEKCGKRYLATELRKYKKEFSITLKGDDTMKITIKKGKEVVKKFNQAVTTSDVISKNNTKSTMARVSKSDEIEEENTHTRNYSVMGIEPSTMKVSVCVPEENVEEDKFSESKQSPDTEDKSNVTPNQSGFNQNTSVQNSPEIDESFSIAKDIHKANIQKDIEEESEKMVEKSVTMSIDPIPTVTETEEEIINDESTTDEKIEEDSSFNEESDNEVEESDDDEEEICIVPRNNNVEESDQEVVNEY